MVSFATIRDKMSVLLVKEVVVVPTNEAMESVETVDMVLVVEEEVTPEME